MFCLPFRLRQLTQVRKLKDVVQYNLFPSAEMILSLGRECGTEKWEPSKCVEMKVESPCQPVRIKRHAPIDTHNEAYKKQLKPKLCKDFIQVTKWTWFSSVLLLYSVGYTCVLFSLGQH